MTLISAEQRAAFERDGYLVLPDAVGPAQLIDLRMQLQAWIEESRGHDAPYGQTIDNLPRFDIAAEHSATAPALRRVNNPAEVYHAMATRCDPARDIIIVDNTRGSPYDPSASPIDGFWRTVGKIGIDATRKGRHHAADFDRTWPINWGTVNLEDYL